MTGLADDVVGRLARARDQLADLNDQIAAVKVRVSSRDRSVSVEVDGTGSMTALTIRSAATRLAADELADLIVNIARTAAEAAVDQQRLLVERFATEFRVPQQEVRAQQDR